MVGLLFQISVLFYKQQMNKKKIFNDPVYGFITIPYDILFDIIENPYFQRLRRISQVGLTHYVYPGALHTRFHHAIGAMHLMTQAIEVLRSKNIEISEEEAVGVSIAILLHDIGHGPFSHALEHTLINIHHEELSLLFMEYLNEEFDGALDLAIQIFTNQYPKNFLYQLVSGQLDMDRMDYLNRDSFFTGVSEGVIGYDRIIKMLSVKEGSLVVEEKGIYSVEKFLIARRLMYWQVYLHKTSIVAEQMLIKVLERAKQLVSKGVELNISKRFAYFLKNSISKKDIGLKGKAIIDNFSQLDDFDIYSALKNFVESTDPILAFLSKSILNRQLFKIELQSSPLSSDYIEKKRQKVAQLFKMSISDPDLDFVIFKGTETNKPYDLTDEVKILFKTGEVIPMSKLKEHGIPLKKITKYYLCYPKVIF